MRGLVRAAVRRRAPPGPGPGQEHPTAPIRTASCPPPRPQRRAAVPHGAGSLPRGAAPRGGLALARRAAAHEGAATGARRASDACMRCCHRMRVSRAARVGAVGRGDLARHAATQEAGAGSARDGRYVPWAQRPCRRGRFVQHRQATKVRWTRCSLYIVTYVRPRRADDFLPSAVPPSRVLKGPAARGRQRLQHLDRVPLLLGGDVPGEQTGHVAQAPLPACLLSAGACVPGQLPSSLADRRCPGRRCAW